LFHNHLMPKIACCRKDFTVFRGHGHPEILQSKQKLELKCFNRACFKSILKSIDGDVKKLNYFHEVHASMKKLGLIHGRHSAIIIIKPESPKNYKQKPNSIALRIEMAFCINK
jgi:hypothetical protein